MATGRTCSAYTDLKLGANGGAMQSMKIDSLGDVGLDYEAVEMSAWVDLVKGVVMGQADFSLEFGGPVDNTNATAPSTLLRTWATNHTLLSFDVQIGVGHAWIGGEQQFGLTGATATNSGVVVTSYKEQGAKYKASIRCTAGTAIAPEWGVAAEGVPV